MPQHLINCPNCKSRHLVSVFKKSGIPVMLVALNIDNCGLEIDNRGEIEKLIKTNVGPHDIEELHRQRIENCEMPREEF